MKDDLEIETDVREEIRWTPDIDGDGIVVAVDDGIVTLSGTVPTYRDRMQAEAAAKRVFGVTGIANDIQVHVSASQVFGDSQIAHDAVAAIRADLPHAADHVQVIVSDGHVRLEGTVEWRWQAQRIESTLRGLAGIKVVSNLLRIQPHAVANDIRQGIEKALGRSAEIEAKNISVDTRDGEVILRGTVRSLVQKDEVLRTAWSAPGVTNVLSEIAVRP
jgi:osmotically-inducible protein OsmY